MIYSDQLRAARSLIGKTQAEVAAAAGVSVPTVKRAEGEGSVAASPAAKAAIAAALENFGVIFIAPEGTVGAGVRWGKADKVREAPDAASV